MLVWLLPSGMAEPELRSGLTGHHLETDPRTHPIRSRRRHLDLKKVTGSALRDLRLPVVFGPEPEVELRAQLRAAGGSFRPPLIQTGRGADGTIDSLRLNRDGQLVEDVPGHSQRCGASVVAR